jgi:hypothetical protein
VVELVLIACIVQKKSASASVILTISAAAGIPAPPVVTSAVSGSAGTPAMPRSTDTTLQLHASAGAHRASFLVPSETDGFVPRRTESGNSFGSCQPYVDAWNASDLAEMSPNPRPHPAGPSMLARRMYEVDHALLAAKETAKVTFDTIYAFLLKIHTLLQSPRFGLKYEMFIANLLYFSQKCNDNRAEAYRQLLKDKRATSARLKTAEKDLAFTKGE